MSPARKAAERYGEPRPLLRLGALLPQRFDARPPQRLRAIACAVAIVVATGIGAWIWIASAGGGSDQQAVRRWFQSPLGGAASSEVVAAIHVGQCEFTDDTVPAGAVLMCRVTTDAPRTPPLHTCFVFAGEKVVLGGWQLAKVGACDALRFDRRTGELIDAPARAHYRVTAG